MFKKESSFSSEIMKGMQQNLISRQVENKYSFDKIAKAVDLLSDAADIFDDAGFKVESEVVTKLLETIAANGMKKIASHEREMTLHDITPEEAHFFNNLPPYTKEHLKHLIKNKNDVDAFVREVKILHEIKKPEVLKMKPLTPEEGVEIVEDPDAFEIESLQADDKKRALWLDEDETCPCGRSECDGHCLEKYLRMPEHVEKRQDEAKHTLHELHTKKKV